MKGNKKKTRKLTIMLAILLSLSLIGNIWLVVTYLTKVLPPIYYSNANSRDTYFSIHNIDEAHEVNKGEGIKIGVLDWAFGFLEHEDLYSGGSDFTNIPSNLYGFNHTSEHGFWMASTLREIAPQSEIYALGTFIPNDEGKWVDALIEAINWSIDNGIDILTLSHQQISPENRGRFDEAVDRAIEHGIVTAFIHYGNPNNILPYGLFNYDNTGDNYGRSPDLSIFHYDYSVFFPVLYHGLIPNAESYVPFNSMSSTSPVVAGFVAILKSVNNSLTPLEYKQILIDTSYSMYYTDKKLGIEDSYIEHIVDIGNAVKYLQEKY